MSLIVTISMQKKSDNWGKNPIVFLSENGAEIYLNGENKLDRIQKAARIIDRQGGTSVILQGNEWNLEFCWHFWLGFKHAFGQQTITFPDLNEQDLIKLNQRIKVVGWMKNIINLSSEELKPIDLAQKSAEFLKEMSSFISYKMIKGNALKEQNYHGIYAVGKSSVNEPVFLEIDFNPINEENAPVFASLVGKGITFDSGGYSLKPSDSMNSMKTDMGGAALVVGSLAFAILNGLNRRVKLYLGCAENLVSGTAFKLGDIIHYRNGKSVEIMNTDAEGRIVLADLLINASADKPEFILDCATLTGAAKVAVGNDYHSVLSFDDELTESLFQSAKNNNEAFWRLPLAEFHRNQLPSNFADLSNIAIPGTAGASTAAGFLSHFVEGYQKNWLHIDCSATYQKSANDKWPAGATGIGVMTLANFLLTYSPLENKTITP